MTESVYFLRAIIIICSSEVNSARISQAGVLVLCAISLIKASSCRNDQKDPIISIRYSLSV